MPAELLELCKEALDEISLLVEPPVAGVRPPSPGSWRNDGNGPGVENGIVEVLGVVGAVGEDVARFDTIQQILAVDHVAAMAGREHEAHRQAQRIDGGMDFGA